VPINGRRVKLTWVAKSTLLNTVLRDSGVMDPGIISLQQPQQHFNNYLLEFFTYKKPITHFMGIKSSLPCFDTVGWAAGRASGL